MMSYYRPMGAQANPYAGWLEDPSGQRGAYYSRLNSGWSPNQQSFFNSQFQPVRNRYEAGLANKARSGQEPTGLWDDFLGGINFEDEWRRLTPNQRGEQTGRYAPSVRWLF